MTHTYNISGMTCQNCQAKVQGLLSGVTGVKNVSIDLSKGEASIDMASHVATAQFQSALKNYPKYKLEEKQVTHQMQPAAEEITKTWLATYKPILIVFTYITGVTLLIESTRGIFIWPLWMQNFMASFFLVFSFFKLLDIRGFAESYSSYDIIAKKWTAWGYVYAYIELALGIAYLTNFNPLLTNIITLIVMSVSIIGVLQSVLNKRKIQCACLGSVFNLPMSTVTIIEDGLMLIMCLTMIVTLI